MNMYFSVRISVLSRLVLHQIGSFWILKPGFLHERQLVSCADPQKVGEETFPIEMKI